MERFQVHNKDTRMALIYLLQLSLLLTLDTAQIYSGFVVNCEFFFARHRHVCKKFF